MVKSLVTWADWFLERMSNYNEEFLIGRGNRPIKYHPAKNNPTYRYNPELPELPERLRFIGVPYKNKLHLQLEQEALMTSLIR